MPNESFTGSSLLDKSKAHPGNIDMSVFAPKSKPPAQGTVNDRYLQEIREQNPDPAEAKKDEAKVSLSKCRFVTPLEDLRLNEPFEFAVDVKKIGEPKSMSPSFDLYCTRTRDGKPERDRIWAGQEGKPFDPKGDPLVVQGQDVLVTQADYVLGETVTFELEATHPEAEQPARSEPVEIRIKALAHWVGGDKPEERSVQITFFAPGSEPPLKEVTDGQKPLNDDNPVQQPDRIEKKKVEKGARGGRASPSGTTFEILMESDPGWTKQLVLKPKNSGKSVVVKPAQFQKQSKGMWLAKLTGVAPGAYSLESQSRRGTLMEKIADDIEIA